MGRWPYEPTCILFNCGRDLEPSLGTQRTSLWPNEVQWRGKGSVASRWLSESLPRTSDGKLSALLNAAVAVSLAPVQGDLVRSMAFGRTGGVGGLAK